jgi:Nidogen-like
MSAKFLSNLPAKSIGFAVTALALNVAMTGIASAAAIRTGFSSNSLAANDDGSAPITALGFTANFFGTNYTNTYVNNNGNLTFTAPLGTFTPFSLTSANTPIIAAFFADIDTRGAGTSPITYGQGTVNGRNAFGANYLNVGYFPSQNNKINDIQIVLVDRADTGAGNFDIEFNYDKIQWETGGASGGTNGLGGSSARVGFSNGTGAPGSFFELAGSGVNGAFLDGGANALIANSLNSNVLGRYTFNSRNGSIVEPTAAVPEPFTIIGTLVGGTAALRMRKKLKSTVKA